MRVAYRVLVTVAAVFFCALPLMAVADGVEHKVVPPAVGAYHGAYADFGATEDEVTVEKIKSFEQIAGKDIAWAYFSDHWTDGKIAFPAANVEACIQAGVVPYIRMTPWSVMEQSQADDINMQDIIDGAYDGDLRLWATSARDAKTLIMIEFGPEVNGDWFPWNGVWNGAGRLNGYGDPHWPDGPERFKDAYIHIIELFRAVGAKNITWVLHVDAGWSPHVDWNRFENYYPGDEYIDYVGVSVFGRQLPQNNWIYFPGVLSGFLDQIESVTAKPILISEYAVIEDSHDPERKAAWLRQALESIPRLFPQVKGMTYWHSPGWLEDGRANFKIYSSPQALETYRTEIADPFWIGKVPGSLSGP